MVEKVALIKIGARISFKPEDKMSSTIMEVMATLALLNKFKVDIYTKKSSRDVDPSTYEVYDLKENFDKINDRDYSKLIVVNGSVPFYGGVDGADDIYNYKIINSFKGKVVYLLFDPYLGLRQIYGNISKKPQYAEHTNSVTIVRDDISYITQCKNTSLINEVGQSDIQYFPLEKFPLLLKNFYSTAERLNTAEFSIVYCGSFRGGRRQDDMIKYLFGWPEDAVNVVGNVKLQRFSKKKVGDLQPPVFSGTVKQKNVGAESMRGVATVLIADPLYIKLDDIAQRAYEAILYGVVVFVDEKVDKNKRLFSDQLLRDFCYVSSRQELMARVEKLKQSPSIAMNIVELQRLDVVEAFNASDYVKEFTEVLQTL